MEIDFRKIPPQQRYKILTAAVIPRPIAFVTTRGINGVDNAAPFSFFNVFGEDPPLVVLGLQSSSDGGPKDTTRNIRYSSEFAINMVDRPIAEAMNVCATDVDEGTSEFDMSGLTRAECRHIDVCRVAEAPITFECKRMMIIQINSTRDLLVGEVLHMHARDGIFDPDNLHLDLDNYDIVGRLFANLYTPIGKTFQHDRMTPEEWWEKSGQ
jgi:flavin reductase (DIM6/NTAB) family NADH-FMN oxidoreductase RutF